MAQSYQAIKNIITGAFIADATIITRYSLQEEQTFDQQFSKLSLENIMFSCVAFALFMHEQLWDVFRTEITTEMEKQQPHTKKWYEGKALGFMLGVPLYTDTDVYDTTGMDDDAIAAAMVVKQAAAVKLISANGYGILRIKVATAGAGGALQPLPQEQYTALKAYMLDKVVDAGTQVTITTSEPDRLRYHANIYFDPTILNPQGARLDGTAATPVQDAISAFLQSIEFNGTLNVKELERTIRNVPGVMEAETTNAASKYGGYNYDQQGIPNVGAITVFRTADGGYFIMDDLQINWTVA